MCHSSSWQKKRVNKGTLLAFLPSTHPCCLFPSAEEEKLISTYSAPPKKVRGGWEAEEGSLGPPHKRPQFQGLTPPPTPTYLLIPPRSSLDRVPRKRIGGQEKFPPRSQGRSWFHLSSGISLLCASAFSGAVFFGRNNGFVIKDNRPLVGGQTFLWRGEADRRGSNIAASFHLRYVLRGLLSREQLPKVRERGTRVKCATLIY